LANCLLTVDDQFTVSRSKLYIKFFQKDIKSPFVSFMPNGGDLFCCEYPITDSMLVVHQLFAGAPERLCLRCNQWYHKGNLHSTQDGGVQATRSPGGCDHFSQVDEMMEVISRC
jgi:hypothetical protein